MSLKIVKVWNIWCKFAPKGRITRTILTKFGVDKGVLGLLSVAKFHHDKCLSVGLSSPKIVKIWNFWCKFVPKTHRICVPSFIGVDPAISGVTWVSKMLTARMDGRTHGRTFYRFYQSYRGEGLTRELKIARSHLIPTQ